MHCATLWRCCPGSCLPSSRLAEFHGVPPAHVAKVMQAVAGEGIEEAASGPLGGYRLARPAGEITHMAVEAIDGHDPSFRYTEIRHAQPPIDSRSRSHLSLAAIFAHMPAERSSEIGHSARRQRTRALEPALSGPTQRARWPSCQPSARPLSREGLLEATGTGHPA
jgi:hypothetical protein